MKNLLIFLISLLGTYFLSAQTTYIPDDNFEQALIDMGYDDVLDDYVLTANINTVDGLHLYNKSITDLTGIEDFTALETLNVNINQLRSLDISQNVNLWMLVCIQNQITQLDVSQNINLTTLKCEDNLLTSLDVSNNVLLFQLNCGNNYITALDLRNNTNLEYFSYDSYSSYPYMQAIESIDLRNGNNSNMQYCSIINNVNLECIYVDDKNAPHNNWHKNYGHYIDNEAECTVLSINDFNVNNSVTLYPNPVSDILYIENTNQVNIQKIELYDVYGKQIIRTENSFDQVNFKNIVPGLYFINIQTEYGTATKKIIKE